MRVELVEEGPGWISIEVGRAVGGAESDSTSSSNVLNSWSNSSSVSGESSLSQSSIKRAMGEEKKLQ